MPKSEKGFIIPVLFFILIAVLGGIFFLFKKQTSITELYQSPSKYCILSSGNLCESKIVELEGEVQGSEFVPGLGYKFVPQKKLLENEIYIGALKYDGLHLGAGIESFLPKIPFGSTVKIKGYVVNNDRYRCSDQAYAVENANYCKESSFRIRVNPSSIIGIPDKSQPSTSYNIFGQIKDLSQVIKTCPQTINFCEDNLGLIKDECFKVNLNKNYCSLLSANSNMFVISGFTKSISDILSPADFYQVNGIDYGSSNLEEKFGGNKYFSKDDGSYGLYNSNGQKITIINTQSADYISPDELIIGKSGVYFFQNNNLYFYEKGKQERISFGSIGNQYKDENGRFYGFTLSKDRTKVVFLGEKLISSEPLGQYLLRKRHISVLMIDLTVLKKDSLQIQPQEIYSQDTDGFVNLDSWDENRNTMFFSYTLDKEQPTGCINKYYFSVNTLNKNKNELFSATVDYNKYCQSTIKRLLYKSADGRYLVFGQDFNQNSQDLRPYKLEVYDLSQEKPVIKSYIADGELLKGSNYQIIDINSSYLTVLNTKDLKLKFKFNLSSDKYIQTSLDAFEKEPAPPGPASPSPSPSPYIKNPILNIEDPRFLYEDKDKMYFFNRINSENQLYSLDKKTKEMYLVETFSPIARTLSVQNGLYIIDTDH